MKTQEISFNVVKTGETFHQFCEVDNVILTFKKIGQSKAVQLTGEHTGYVMSFHRSEFVTTVVV